MDNIKHFVLPENTNSLYEKEAISSVALTRDVASKINELVDAYNELSATDLAWKQEQEGTIRKGVVYMKDNLVNSLNDLMETLIANGFIDKRIENNVKTLKDRLDNLIGSVSVGTSTMDAEIIDGRVGHDKQKYVTIGEAIRGQIDDIISSVLMVSDMINDHDTRNFVYINKVVAVSVDSTLKVAFDRNSQTFTINGITSSNNNVFDLYVTGNETLTTVDPYILFDDNFPLNGGTWGVAVYYTDGSIQAHRYTNNGRFFVVDKGKTIEKIQVIFSSGFTFNNVKSKLFGSYYENGGIQPREEFYTLKKIFGSNLKGKKWVSIGDSLTENAGNTVGARWQDTVADFFGMTPVVIAKGGRTTSGFLFNDMYNNIPDDADIITVMGGTNDFAQDLQVEVTDTQYYTNDGHYAGAVRHVIKRLQEDYPNAKLIFCNCLGTRLTYVGVNQDTPIVNAQGKTLTDYARKCKEVCMEMGVPCIDLCGESGISIFNGASYFADEVHPNAKGYDRIADVYIQNFKRMF